MFYKDITAAARTSLANKRPNEPGRTQQLQTRLKNQQPNVPGKPVTSNELKNQAAERA